MESARWGLVVRYLDVNYLRHQWSDGTDTLQFGRTAEYYETVEYERDRSFEP